MKRTNMSMMKLVTIAISLMLVMSIVAGCVGKKNTGQEDEQKRVLRIALMYGSQDSEEHYRTQYTDIFKFNNMNVDIEFVYAIDYNSSYYQEYDPDAEQPVPIEEMKKLLNGSNPPDLVFLDDITQLGSLVNENLLEPLDQRIEADKFDISDFVPAVIDGIKEVGNNQLYALAPTFSSQALVYNKGIFDERNVPYPTDGMTWSDVFDLATLVTSGEGAERKSGFSFNTYAYSQDLYYSMGIYTAPLELSMLTEDQQSMAVDSQSWRDAWSEMLRLNELNILPEQENYNDYGIMREYNRYSHNAFISGKLAMALIDYYSINELINANRNADTMEGFEPVDWDVVTIPVHEQYPFTGSYVYMNPIMGINAKAQNSADAWNFIKFMNGEDWADLKSMSTNNMVSRASYIKTRDGIDYNVSAFYQLLPAPVNRDYELYSNRLREVMWRIESIGQEKFNKLLAGDIDVDSALKEWKNEGDSLLQQFRDNPDVPLHELLYGEDMGMSIDQLNMMKAAGESIEMSTEAEIIFEDAPEAETAPEAESSDE